MNHDIRCSTRLLKGEDGIFKSTDDRTIVAGVIDGHGGDVAMKFCRDHAVDMLNNSTADNIEDALRHLFRELHKLVCSIEHTTSGCCLTVVVYNRHDGTYVCGNVGDVEAIHISKTSFWAITTSHRLQHNAEERTRLNPYVDNKIGPPRLFPGGVSCSRSIGDRDAPHVICEPSLSVGCLNEGESLLIATDGFWDFFDKPKARAMCLKYNHNPTKLLSKIGELKDDSTCVILSDSIVKSPSMLRFLFPKSASNSSISEMGEDDCVSPNNTSNEALIIPVKLADVEDETTYFKDAM